MLKSLLLTASLLLAGLAQAADRPHVLIATNYGDIELELDGDAAPLSVRNFLQYVEAGHYQDTVFHRVIPGFMIQGGGFTETLEQKPTQAPVKNEADNGLKNARGTIAMARTAVVDSATSQFFINLNDNDFLNHGSRDFGYAVFGKVVRGMDVVDKIAGVKTSNYGMHQNVPQNPVFILEAKKL